MRPGELALLAIVLACLTGLIIIRVRRRRRARRDSAYGSPGAQAARGRHAVGGPAGSGKLPAAPPDFTRGAVEGGGIPDPPPGWADPGTHHPSGDPSLGEPGTSGPAPDGPWDGGTPAGEAEAENGSPGAGAPPGILRSWGVTPEEDAAGQTPAGPPWEPAGKPPGEPPWESAAAPWEQDRNAAPPPRLLRPDAIADVWPPRPPDSTGR
jgi:hypothetical protein